MFFEIIDNFIFCCNATPCFYILTLFIRLLTGQDRISISTYFKKFYDKILAPKFLLIALEATYWSKRWATKPKGEDS